MDFETHEAVNEARLDGYTRGMLDALDLMGFGVSRMINEKAGSLECVQHMINELAACALERRRYDVVSVFLALSLESFGAAKDAGPKKERAPGDAPSG